MKKIKQIVLVVSMLTITGLAFAPKTNNNSGANNPSWVSDKGFWVIETNVKTPKSSIVHFYKNDRQLIYSEKVEGRKLKVKRKRTLVQLKNALVKAIYAWEKHGEVKDQALLAVKR